LLRCMSPVMAHRDILRRRAILVAFGVEADIDGWARLGGSVVIDPDRTSTFFGPFKPAVGQSLL
jgi:hypothetical protein